MTGTWLAPEVILSLYNSVILIVYRFCTCATYKGRLNFKRITTVTVMSFTSLTSLCVRISSVGRALDSRVEGRGVLIPVAVPILMVLK